MDTLSLSKKIEEIYHSLFQDSLDGIYISTLDGKYIDVNPALVKILGYSSKEELLSINIPEQFYVSEKDMLTPYRRAKSFESRLKKKDGSIIWVEIVSRVIYDGSNAVCYGGIVKDITARKESEKEIKYLSFHDKLTDLYNRAYFEEELKRLNTKRQLPLSIVIGDVNGLKLVNDAFGHMEGDKLLKKIARILKSCCREEDIIARWGGD
ncbi:MAG: diguanylate cyclase, partial [Candidatus Hydromicrobium sp.]|nr:diguanylate cyclase [Candidatus Hydromicrobium sp.]